MTTLQRHPLETASRIARQGLGLAPAVGPVAASATTCHLCGARIAAGDVALPWTAGAGWMDEAAYASSSGVICADCAPLLTAPVLRLGGVLVHRTGAFRLFTAAELGRALVDPPCAPPFVAVFPTGKMQHLLWRAAVTYDRDCFRLQLGERRVAFDVPRLRGLEADARSLARHLPPPAGKASRTMCHPFSRLGMKPGELRISIHPTVRTAATSPEDRAALRRLASCSADEAFALTGLTYGSPTDRVALPAARALPPAASPTDLLTD
jgi:CRISPR type IV-associated protein Csf1